MNICQKCGLPKELCVCESIAKESQRIKVYTEKKKFGKLCTMVEGIDPKSINMRDVVRTLKAELACGGTFKEGRIELQGEHRQKAKNVLVKLGFAPETIELR